MDLTHITSKFDDTFTHQFLVCLSNVQLHLMVTQLQILPSSHVKTVPGISLELLLI